MTHDTAFVVLTFLYKILYFALKKQIEAFSLNKKNYPFLRPVQQRKNVSSLGSLDTLHILGVDLNRFNWVKKSYPSQLQGNNSNFENMECWWFYFFWIKSQDSVYIPICYRTQAHHWIQKNSLNTYCSIKVTLKTVPPPQKKRDQS